MRHLLKLETSNTSNPRQGVALLFRTRVIVDNSGYLPKSSTLDLKANSALQQSMFDAYADVLTSGHTSDFINNATAGMQSSGLIPNFQLLLDNSITPQEFTKNVQAQYDKEAKR